MELPPDFSISGMFASSTLLVQIIMLLLLIASVRCWAVFINKLIQYRSARAEAKAFEYAFWSGTPLDELFDRMGPEFSRPTELIFAAGLSEWRRSQRPDGSFIPEATTRINIAMDIAIAKQSARLVKDLPDLGTIGATAPFAGLFGTVWGIMNAFIEISGSQNTNLSVVAPGVAEALLTTGIGLIVAIPAVLIYNKLLIDSDEIVSSYESFADEFSIILSRQSNN